MRRLSARTDNRRGATIVLVAVTLLVLAIVAAVATWVVLNGINPIHLTAPAS